MYVKYDVLTSFIAQMFAQFLSNIREGHLYEFLVSTVYMLFLE